MKYQGEYKQLSNILEFSRFTLTKRDSKKEIFTQSQYGIFIFVIKYDTRRINIF